ncbi:MAG: CotH kinase family protein [Muribaculum sp.]|nr:CotH kinase family protein [Muribaculaceae bacterium]MCM1080386.1 CotH kinase family protein [Muribaculum sp.]
MKNILSALLILVTALTAVTQHPHVHIYRQDGKFTTGKVADIDKFKFQSTAWGDKANNVTVEFNDGTSETVDVDVIDSTVIGTNVPVIRVNLLDYPTIKDLYKTGDFTKSTIYRATLSMDGNGYYDDIPETEVEFRGRGNSTWKMAKTPYRFKLPKKQSVCGLAKAKSFALIANYLDCSMMRNAIALKLAQLLGLPFSNHTVPVNVYLNGNYRGAYFLTEKIGIGGGSVDIDETKGMLFEIDTNYDEDYKFRYTFTYGNRSKNLPVMVKDPDLVELAEEAAGSFTADEYFNQWKADITKMLNAVTQRGSNESLSDVLDINTVADYLLVYVVARNRELNHPKSFYMFKEELGDNSVYKFGPAWDFDWGFTYDGSEGAGKYNDLLFTADGNAGGYSFFRLLLQNKELLALFNQKWDNFYTNIWPELRLFMDDYAAIIEPSAKTNGMIWPRDGSYKNQCSFDFRTNYKTLTEFLEKRVQWLNSHKNHGLY